MELEQARKARQLLKDLDEADRALNGLRKLAGEECTLRLTITSESGAVYLQGFAMQAPTKDEVVTAIYSQMEYERKGIESQIALL